MLKLLKIAAVLPAVALATAALAQQNTPGLGKTVSPSEDSVDKVSGHNANEMICEVQPVLGTRLAARKVCATRAEWAERRQEERMSTEKLQRNMPTKGN